MTSEMTASLSALASTKAEWAMLLGSAPFTASILEWGGCLRWRSGCRSAAAARCFGRSCR